LHLDVLGAVDVVGGERGGRSVVGMIQIRAPKRSPHRRASATSSRCVSRIWPMPPAAAIGPASASV
jgi:hypothetical protein